MLHALRVSRAPLAEFFSTLLEEIPKPEEAQQAGTLRPNSYSLTSNSPTDPQKQATYVVNQAPSPASHIVLDFRLW